MLPHATFQPITAFTSEGARMSGHMLLDSCAIKVRSTRRQALVLSCLVLQLSADP